MGNFFSTALHQQLFYEGALAQAVFDLEFKVVEANARFLGLALVSRPQALGLGFRSLFPAAGEVAEGAMQRALRDSEVGFFTFDGFLAESSGQRSLRHWQVSLQPLRNEAGVAQWVIATLVDATRPTESDERSRELLFLFHCLIEQSPDAIFFKDRQGVYRYINPAGARMVNRTPETVIGRKDSEIFRPEDAEKIVATDRIVMQSPRGSDTYQDEDYIDGRRMIMQTHKTVVRTVQGELLGLTGHARDITVDALRTEERQRLIESLEQTRRDLEVEREMRERLVADLGHDLRSPLSVAKMASDLLGDGPASAALAQEFQTSIRPALGRMDHMIRDLLDSSKIRAGHPVLVRRKICDLRDTLERCLKEMNFLYPGRLEAPFKLPPVVGLWDCTAVQRVLENLVHNAIRHGDRSRPVTIQVRFESGQILLSVHNDGLAIPEETRRHLFHRFQRDAASNARGLRGEGWGLGLSIVNSLVSAMEGTVSVESHESDGTRFLVTLPVLPLV